MEKFILLCFALFILNIAFWFSSKKLLEKDKKPGKDTNRTIIAMLVIVFVLSDVVLSIVFSLKLVGYQWLFPLINMIIPIRIGILFEKKISDYYQKKYPDRGCKKSFV